MRESRERIRRRRRRRRLFWRAAVLAVTVAVCLVGVKAFTEHALREWDLPKIWNGKADGEEKESDVSDGWIAAEADERSVGDMKEAAAGDFMTKPDYSEPDLTQLYSPCAVLTEADSGRILTEHNGQKRVYPASLTKVMTAVIVLENLTDLSETITLSTEMFGMLYVRHASLAGFEPGETVSVEDLLYGILLPSGAECSIACAERIAGSEAGFVELMNQKAADLGMKDTRFCNVTGLHEKKHYSTVCDMAVLMRYALQNDVFRQILSCKSHTTGATGFHPEGLTFTSTLFGLLDTAEVPGGEILGGKTGYTNEAGLCLASFARIGGREYILVTAGAEGSHQTEAFHVLDAKKVYGELE